MKKALGVIEFKGIARGIKAADAMIKAAQVDLMASATVCPGKYMTFVSGDVGAVNSAVTAGRGVGAETIMDWFILPNVHPTVFPALHGTTGAPRGKAVGIIETFTGPAAIVAGDAAVKAADIQLLEIRLARGLGGKAIVVINGDVGAVKAGLASAVQAISETGVLVDEVLIPSAHPDLLETLI